MAHIAPNAEEISSEIAESVRFRDCGANLERISCSSCNAELSLEWWHQQFGDEDYWEDGIDLKPIRLPCGHVAESLNELTYHFDVGFSRFILDAMNPDIGPLGSSEIARFKAILGCDVKIIYQHI